jgi:hypothetical protein
MVTLALAAPATALIVLLAGCVSGFRSPDEKLAAALQSVAAAIQSCSYGVELLDTGKTTRQQLGVLLADMLGEVSQAQRAVAELDVATDREARNRAEVLRRVAGAQGAVVSAREHIGDTGYGAELVARLDAAVADLRGWKAA